jgi:hypothetical protein
VTAPETTVIAIISAISDVGSPMRLPQTAASVPKAPLMTPTRSTVRNATGELWKSRGRSILTRVSGRGDAAVDSAVGRMASEKRIAPTMNSVDVPGSPTPTPSWPAVMPR